jgi:kynureninase
MKNDETWAREQDAKDPLASYREAFHFPGKDIVYLAGNSLGLQPKKAREYVNEALDDWAEFGVEGHFHAKHPWLPYHELLTDQTARLVGALPSEVVVMNTLTVNLHLMLVAFYRPTKTRFKLMVEAGAFPSDQYAVASQAKHHGFDPAHTIVELAPREGEDTLREEDILAAIAREGESLALVMLGNINYLTGQAFNMKAITAAAHKVGARCGFDLAHGAGNLLLQLHDDGPDFAVWCNYKYLNAGPGGLGGVFVHERHATADLPRFAGWWGHNKTTRFKMGKDFSPIPGAEGFQLSNPPILQLAALRASMDLFDKATMPALRRKGDALTGYLAFLLEPLNDLKIITPPSRGSQLSLRVQDRGLTAKLKDAHVICDFREPDIMRAAPAPLYNTFLDVFRFATILRNHLGVK